MFALSIVVVVVASPLASDCRLLSSVLLLAVLSFLPLSFSVAVRFGPFVTHRHICFRVGLFSTFCRFLLSCLRLRRLAHAFRLSAGADIKEMLPLTVQARSASRCSRELC